MFKKKWAENGEAVTMEEWSDEEIAEFIRHLTAKGTLIQPSWMELMREEANRTCYCPDLFCPAHTKIC